MTVPIAPGAGVALVTLFDGDGALLPGATGELAARIVAAGAASVLVGGTTGEYYALSDAERVSLFASVRAAVPAPVPVIGHVGGVPADRAAALSREAAAAGLTALLALPPAGTDLRAYYETVADAGHLPVLAYHLPQAGAVIPLADLPGLPVSGIKDSSGDAGRLTMEVFTLAAEVYTGSAALLGLAGDIGASGALTGLANAFPELCAAALAGDASAQREVARLSVHQAGDFPGGLKQLTADRWQVPAFARTPAGRPLGQAVG